MAILMRVHGNFDDRPRMESLLLSPQGQFPLVQQTGHIPGHEEEEDDHDDNLDDLDGINQCIDDDYYHYYQGAPAW